MTTIPQKELRNNIGEILRRAEAGEEFTVTVSGRPVARLGPAEPRRWVSTDVLSRLWATLPPESLHDELPPFDAEMADPFE